MKRLIDPLGGAARLLSACLLLLLLAGCGSARRGVPLHGPLQLGEAEARGEQVFMAYCHKCHPGGEAGLGPALNNKPLPGFLIRFQVRHGLGVMPPHSRAEITPEELDALVAYLVRLRRHTERRQVP